MPLVLKSAREKPLESNCSQIQKLELSLRSSSKSLEFRCLATLVVHCPHRSSQTAATSEPAMKMAAEGLTLTLIQMLIFSDGLGPHFGRQLSGPRSLQSWPKFTNVVSAFLPDWPRFACLIFSTNPVKSIGIHVDWIERGHRSIYVSSNPLVGSSIHMNFNLVLNPSRVLLSANISRSLSDESFAMKEDEFSISASPRSRLMNYSRFGNLAYNMPAYAFIETKSKQSTIASSPQSRIQLTCKEFSLRDTDSPFSASSRLQSDLEGLPSPCFLSFCEHLVKDSSPTSKDHVILTIHQFPEAFAEVVSTHLWITCGKSSCFQGLMVILLNYGSIPIYHSLANLSFVKVIVSNQVVEDLVSFTPLWD